MTLPFKINIDNLSYQHNSKMTGNSTNKMQYKDITLSFPFIPQIPKDASKKTKENDISAVPPGISSPVK